MSYVPDDHIVQLIKQLVQSISGFEEGSNRFKKLQNVAISHLKKSDTLFSIAQPEVNKIVGALSDKFTFHGYNTQARDLKEMYNQLTPHTVSSQELNNRLNIIKFLLGVSESPTNNFEKHPYKLVDNSKKEIIDWSSYLREGIPRWSPPPDDDTSESDSNGSDEDFSVSYNVDKTNIEELVESKSEILENDNPLVVYQDSKTKLIENVQSIWYNIDEICVKPASNDRDANIALLWDKHLDEMVQGLIPIQNSNIITEYKILREIIWQLHEPHTSSCFKFSQNSLVPKVNLTIASVRLKCFESFLYEFIPYIEWLQMFRDFNNIIAYESTENVPPNTYKSYNIAVQTIIEPVTESLNVLEEKIKEQGSTMTLLMLANEIKSLFESLRLLKNIHLNAVIDFRTHSSLICATTLLCHLHTGLYCSSSKLEQDIYLTLYLQSLYKYFSIIDSWFNLDILEHYTDEFVIVDNNPKDSHVLASCFLKAKAECKNRTAQVGEQDWQMNFMLKELDDDIRSDEMINIICTQVLQIGRNIHLLRLLSKIQLIPQFNNMYKDTLYEDFISRILSKISHYFNTKEEVNKSDCELQTEVEPCSLGFPTVCLDNYKYLTDMDKLENVADTSNGFLVNAFGSFFGKQEEIKPVQKEENLFNKIRKLTKSLFPVQEIVSDAFSDILKERFSISGTMVKNVLVNEYNLENQITFLHHIFLFKDDIIFLFYRRIFEQFDSNGQWGNCILLSSYLQDIIMDMYPKFSEYVIVDVKENWRVCIDPLKMCKMINVQYQIQWPLNIIIRNEHMEMYKDLFRFILLIKWALHTLNHLYFSELESRGRSMKAQHKLKRMLITKLKILRFGLLNIFSSIQHYILGHVFHKLCHKFQKAFQDSYDLDSLLKAHADFIEKYYRICYEFQEYNSSSYGFNLLLYLVRKLRVMWRNLSDLKEEDLEKCEKSYRLCHMKMNCIINPTSFMYTSVTS